MSRSELLPAWIVESEAAIAAREGREPEGDPLKAVKYRLWFKSALDKAKWLNQAALFDAKIPYIGAVARLICQNAGVEGGINGDSEKIARALHAWVRDSIFWVEDPGDEEQFESSDLVIDRGFDDCDGKARAFVAMCNAMGLDARIKAIFSKPDLEDFVHVQAEVKWPGSDKLPESQSDGYITAELILPNVELGEGSEAQQSSEYV